MTFQQIATLVILLAILAFAIWAVRVSGEDRGSEEEPQPGNPPKPAKSGGKKS